MADPWALKGDDDSDSGYMDDTSFRATMDSVYGRGNWHPTGGWRSQARENELRRQGAGTTRPGVISAHSRGTRQAPGAWDIQVDGMTPQQAAAKLRGEQVPVGQVLAEGQHGNQGAHLHVAMVEGARDPWAMKTGDAGKPDPWAMADPWSKAPATKTTKRGLNDTVADMFTTLAGGMLEAGGEALRGFAGIADVGVHTAAGVEGRGGQLIDQNTGAPIPLPELSAAQRHAQQRLAETAEPVVMRAAGPTASSIVETGRGLQPEDANSADRFVEGAGRFAPAVGAFAVNPVAGAATFGAQGFGSAYEEAKAAGASDAEAERAASENAAVQGGLGMVPVSHILAPLARPVTGRLAGAAARTGLAAVGNAALGGAMQTGANVVARENYDPERGVFEGVPESALEMGLAGGVIHAGGEGLAALRARRAAGEGRPAAAPDAMPETTAADAYAAMARGAGVEGEVPVDGNGFAMTEAHEPMRFQTQKEAARYMAANRLGGGFDIENHPGGGFGVKRRAGMDNAEPPSPDHIPPAPPPHYEEARAAEGAPVEEMPAAIKDVEAARTAPVAVPEAEAELAQAEVLPEDSAAVAAAKLAAYRRAVKLQTGDDMGTLRRRADLLGVPHAEGQTFDELLSDVVSHEAALPTYDGWGADHDENQVDAVLTPDEHERLASPEAGARGEQGTAEATAVARRAEASEPAAARGDLEPGAHAGGDRGRPPAVPESVELTHVDPNAIVAAWGQGWGPFADRHKDIRDALAAGTSVGIPTNEFERTVTGQPFEPHLRANIANLDPNDPWAMKGDELLPKPQPKQPSGPIRPETGELEPGESHVATPAGNRIRVRQEVVALDELVPATGDLQNRDRTKGGTDLQIRDIIAHFDPSRLGDSAETDRGSPIIGPDNIVESGNGRVLALTKIYTDPTLASRREAYERFLMDQGVDFAGIDKPVLVRRRMTDMTPEQRRRYIVDSNKDAKLALTATEEAGGDADVLNGETLALYRGGDVDAAQNRDFVRAFMAVLPAGDAGALIDDDGGLNKKGVARIENALLAAAYQDTGLLSKLVDDRNNDIRSIGGALLDQAGNWAKLRAAIADGEVKPGFDVTKQLVAAAKRVSDARKRGEKITDVLEQQDVFNPMDPITEGFIRSFYISRKGGDDPLALAAGRESISDVLGRYVRRAMEQTDEPDLLGGRAPVTAAQILHDVLGDRASGDRGPDLFAAGEPLHEKPAEPQPESERGKGYGEKNKTFTKEDAEDARRKIREAMNRLNAGIDPELIHAGITLAGYHVEAGARRFADYAQAMLNDLGEQIRPYLRMWYNALRDYPGFDADGMTPAHEITEAMVEEAARDVSGGSTDLEPGGAGAAAADAYGQGAVPSRPGEPERGAGDAGAPAGPEGDRSGAGVGVPDRGPPLVGTAGDLGLFAGQPEPGGGAAERGEPGGGVGAGDQGVQPDRIPAEALDEIAADAAHLEPVAPDAHPYAESPDAPPVPADIEAALPTLFPEQRADVAFAEERFAQPDGHGVMFTNGTGTGKTFTGGGIIKRFVDQGKTDILVVAPTQGILNHWLEASEKLGIPLRMLESTSTAGAGVVGTTYANLTNNRTLADRGWHLVVADEAHTLMSQADGKETGALKNFRAITNHPSRLRHKASMHLREQEDAVDLLRAQIPKGAMSGEAYDRWWNARRALDEKAGALAETFKDEPRSKVVFLSATPFAYDKNVDYANGYLFDYGPEPKGGYNSGSAQDQFMMRHFGYRMRYGKLTKPEAGVESDIMERQFHEWMRQQGYLSGRALTVDKDYDRKFMLTPNAIGSKIDQAIDFLNSADEGKFRDLANQIGKRFDYLSRMRLLEAIKASESVPIIRQHLKLGRKVVVFHDYNHGGGFSPFARPDDVLMVGGMREGVPLLDQLYDEFVARNPYVDELNDQIGKLPAPLITLQRAFPDALIYNGEVPKAQRERAKAMFNRDGSGKDLIIVQSQAGQAGISLHDTTGKHQRVLLNIGMPGRPVAAIQQEGRIYRIGQASDAVFRYLNTGTNWERYTFASRIAQRAGTAENLAMGEGARTLRDSFINAFIESAPNPPARGEGRGGKKADFDLAKALTEFQKAKSFYFAESKKAGRRDNREGKDYFATPEPLGLKMVEWADIRPNEDVLEPSAGHGAIARFFPETAKRTLIEPSPSLASRASLSSPGAEVKNERFEDLHAVNKYDAIIMNPPFGHAGATAIEHLRLAAGHLRDKGRIVALIPRGATDAKFDAFMESDAAANIYQVADINLPPVTFERAGTKVSARVVVLEKQIDPAARDKLRNTNRDYTNAEKIGDLFDRIEDSTIPDRQAGQRMAEAAPAAETPVPAAAAADMGGFELKQTLHGKTGAALYVAVPKVRVEREAYNATLAVAKAHGGYYSSFRGSGAVPGFQFKTEAERQAFVDEMAAGASVRFQRPRALYERETPFYSAATRAIENSTTKAATPAQWKATLDNAQGVKREELDWTGVKEWLDLFPEGEKVPKDKVAAFMREHGVRVSERVLSDLSESERSHVMDVGRAIAEEEPMPWGDALDQAGRETGFREPQYSDWKEPGGEDYHELLLTLPEVANPPATHWDTEGVMAHVRFDTRQSPDGKKVLFVEEVQSDWHQKGRDQGYAKPVDPEEVGRLGGLEETARQVEREAARKAGDAAITLLRAVGVPESQIEKPSGPEGYGRDVLHADAIARQIRIHPNYPEWGNLRPIEMEAFRAASARYGDARLRHIEARQAYENARHSDGIADAPFKSSWPALVMKRVIAWAADHGFDRVAWTTGEQQAERYNLTKHVGKLVLEDNNSGGAGKADLEGPFSGGILHIYSPEEARHGVRASSERHYRDREALEAELGKELTERLLAAEPTHSRSAGIGMRRRELAGLDLKIGGEGMRAFYDRNLVNITNDIIKKYGAKVEKLPVHIHTTDHQAENLEREAQVQRNLADHYVRIGQEQSAERNYAGAEEKDAIAKRMRQGSQQHGFDITDKMREAATNGLPLFKAENDNLVRVNDELDAEPIDDLNREIALGVTVGQVVDHVDKIIARIAPKAEVRVYQSLGDLSFRPVHGMFFREGASHIIVWSLGSDDWAGTGRHEALHALRSQGLFKPAEWDALEAAALEHDWLGRYDIADTYSDYPREIQIEEAIASRFADWAGDRTRVTDLPSFVRALFERIWRVLQAVKAAIRKALGADISAADVFASMERGDIGRRTERASQRETTAFQRPTADDRTLYARARATRRTRGIINRMLGEGVDAVGAKISRAPGRFLPDPLIELGANVRMAANPMAAGTPRAKAMAKDFANALREHIWEWNRVDQWLEKNFDREARARMWAAADEESVILQQGDTPGADEGLNSLPANERAAVDELQRRANVAFNEAKALKMTAAEGLPSYVPRMVVEMTGEGARRVRTKRAGTAAGVGGNLHTSTGNLRQRKHRTVEETEAAAREHFGEGAAVIRDIRTLAFATGKLEQAIAGRRLINQIKEATAGLGDPAVTEGGTQNPEDVFTLDHPAFRSWRPRFTTDPDTGKTVPITDPATGKPVFEAVPLYVSKEFEGPLKAVLSSPTGPIVRALTTIKAKTMSVIMYSPLIHNAVIWGKAIPAAPRSVLMFTVYFKGNKAKNDPATMREAIRAGLDPIGRRYFNQDITALVESPQIEPGRSWTAKLIGAIPGFLSKDAGNATKAAIDRAGDVWHNTFLWDRVGDLQMGLYAIMRDSFVKHGLEPSAAQRVAAHYANRYAGALPIEAMSKLARNMANLLLFSRSFTFTNIGAWKDALVALPGDVQAQIERDGGLEMLKAAQGTARGKGIGLLIMDIALAHIGLMLAASAIYWLHQWLNEPQDYQPPSANEPDKQNRFLIDYDNDGTAIYGRLPTGKVGEDLQDWVTEPVATGERKLSPFAKVGLEIASNDKGFGRKLYDPNDYTPAGYAKNLGRVVLGADLSSIKGPDDITGGLLGSIAPMGLIKGATHLAGGQGDHNTALMQTILPVFGITVSRGAPGGPAAGELFRAKDEHDFKVAERMPRIRIMIRDGKIAEARAEMRELGIAPGLQSYYVRTTRNPAARLGGRKLADFMRYASPEAKDQYRADQRAAAKRRAGDAGATP